MPDTAEETAARARVTAAAEVAGEASKLLLQLRGLLAASDVSVPVALDSELYTWLNRHAGAK